MITKSSALNFLREQELLNKDSCCQRTDIEYMITLVTGSDRAKLYSDSLLLKKNDIQVLFSMIKERLSGVPLAYILGTKGFWNLDLKVDRNVLVPRPETETLIESVLENFKKNKISVLDAGTGSGAIALALAKEREQWNIYASDFSIKALMVAKQNMIHLNLNIGLIRSNWTDCLKENSLDLIISNPPYIDAKDIRLKDDGIHFEPYEALVADDNGYKDLFEIVRNSRSCLKRGGVLYLEHSPEQAKDIKLYLEKHGYTDARARKDLNGDNRITFAIRD